MHHTNAERGGFSSLRGSSAGLSSQLVVLSHLLTQLENRVDKHLGTRRAARQIDIHRNNMIRALDNGVVVEHAAR